MQYPITMTISAKLCRCAVTITAVLSNTFSLAQEEPEKPLWTAGPLTADLGQQSEVEVPKGFVYAGAAETRMLMEQMGNLLTGEEVGFVAPESLEWFVVFEFSETGYIKDDEKADLDADAMLASIQAGTEEGNEERKKRGWSTLHITGWHTPPKYNETTHNLEWATLGQSEDGASINYNTRILGRHGVMKVTFVGDPSALDGALPAFRSLIAAHSYKSGNRYAEYRSGDKLATYGLAALVTGGAAVAAVKSGLLAKLWKPILFGLIAFGAFFKRIFSSLFGRRKNPFTTP